MYRKVFRLLSLVRVLAIAFSTISTAAAQPVLKVKGGGQVADSPNGVYIVQMINAPVVAYQGDVPGFSATKPNKGEKINPNSAAVVKYAAFLTGSMIKP